MYSRSRYLDYRATQLFKKLKQKLSEVEFYSKWFLKFTHVSQQMLQIGTQVYSNDPEVLPFSDAFLTK